MCWLFRNSQGLWPMAFWKTSKFHLPPSQGEVYLPLYPPPQGRFGTHNTRARLPSKPSSPALSLPTFDSCLDIASKVQKCTILVDVVTFWGSQVSNLRGAWGPFGGPSGAKMGDDLWPGGVLGPVGAILGFLGPILGPFGAILEPLGILLGPFCGHFGRSGGHLGASLGHFGLPPSMPPRPRLQGPV